VAGANTRQFNDDNFEAEVLQSEQPVLVDFWAEWCQPCLMLAPTIDKLANEYAGRIKVGKVDVDKSPTLASRYEVQSIPLVVLFENGQAVARVVGAKPEKEYRSLVDSKLGV